MTEVLDPQPQTQMDAMMDANRPRPEHLWLKQFLGEWTYETEGDCGPGGTPFKMSGTETVRAVGDLWIQAESQMISHDGSRDTSIMTLGYDPQKGTFVGTWLSTMMAFLWLYEAELDANGRVLPLAADGPSFETEGAMAKYQDVHEIVNEDHRTMTARMLAVDGEWHQMMVTRYWRKPS
jgi:hypothetical protein